MTEEEINNLKADIIKELNPIMVDNALSPVEKFNFYFAIASSTMQLDALNNALIAAKQIDDTSIKANSLLSLLDLVSEIQQFEFTEDEDNELNNQTQPDSAIDNNQVNQ